MANHFLYPFEKDGRLDDTPESYRTLTEYEKYQLSFHPERPKYLDYLAMFEQAEACCEHEGRGGCLIQSHRCVFRVDGIPVPVMTIGQQTGPSSDYATLTEALRDPQVVQKWNHGMPTPVSYARAAEAVRTAAQERRAIITFVDTPGADPTEESEAGGIAWRIGDTIRSLVEADVPTIAVIMNRACSGGAIGLTACDRVLGMEYSTYLVITPEACSSILFRTRSRANEAAAASRVTSREGFELGIVDEVIPEPDGPAHRNPRKTVESVRNALERHLRRLLAVPAQKRFEERVRRWASIGRSDTISEEEVQSIQRHVSRLPVPTKEGYVKRHADCRDSQGKRVYDPVVFEALRANNYVCETCGERYTRPSVWDYIDLILDPGTFAEHAVTRHIADRDILGFPGYAAKLDQARRETGLVTAMITGHGSVLGERVVFCGADFGFLGGSFSMSTGEKIWRAATVALQERLPMVLVASGGGARMHEGCSSMVSIPKVHVALTRVEREGLPVITIITDPTVGGVAIGYASRGIRLFEVNAGNIGFSGKRVIEQYTGRKTSPDFQTTAWLQRHGHVERVVSPKTIREEIAQIIRIRPR